MANQKNFVTHGPENETAVLVVQRMADDFYLQSGDGSFGASESIITMDAYLDDGSSNDFGYYEHLEDRTAWDDGYYRVFMGWNDGTGTYEGLSAYIVRVVGDTLMESVALSSLTARNATAPISESVTAIIAALETLSSKVDVLDSNVDHLKIHLSRTAPRNGNG